MQPLNNLDKSRNLTGRRASFSGASPPMKSEDGEKRENAPGERGTDFRCSSSTCKDRDLEHKQEEIS